MEHSKLIISPHIDDEILGCGGILDKNSYVLECGVDKFHVVSRERRIEELEAASQLLGFTYQVLTNLVNSYEVSTLIDQFSDVINKVQPASIYIPYPSYNQDHQAVYEAALVALRPHDANFFVKRVLVYEQPHVFLWDYTHNINAAFKPNYFVPIDPDKKVEAYKCIASQVRSFRSPDCVMMMAEMRGRQSDLTAAEAFQIIRWVE